MMIYQERVPPIHPPYYDDDRYKQGVWPSTSY